MIILQSLGSMIVVGTGDRDAVAEQVSRQVSAISNFVQRFCGFSSTKFIHNSCISSRVPNKSLLIKRNFELHGRIFLWQIFDFFTRGRAILLIFLFGALFLYVPNSLRSLILILPSTLLWKLRGESTHVCQWAFPASDAAHKHRKSCRDGYWNRCYKSLL